MTLDIIFALVLILLNGIFSLSEMAIVSSRKARLQQQADSGNAGAKAALELSNSPNEFLSTVQIGITLVGTLAGAFSGATIAEKIEPYFEPMPLIGNHGGTVSLVLVVLTITLLTLVLGELAPKSLALNNPEKIAMRVAAPMRILSRIAAPLVRLLTFMTEGLLRLLGVKPATDQAVTPEEIQILMAQAGTFEDVEHDIVENVFRLDELRVTDVMTPRPDVVLLNVDTSIEEIMQKMMEHRHSRYPVYQDDVVNILGVVAIKDMWEKMCRSEAVDIKTILSQPLFFPENTPILSALQQMKDTNIHLALVIDEYSHIQGLLTPTNILTAIVGDIAPSETDLEAPLFVQREDGSWLVEGVTTIERFKDKFEIDLESADEKVGYQTLGGFVMSQLERVPQASDKFEWQDIRFEVMDMDGRRVDKVLVTLPAKNSDVVSAAP